MNARGAFCLLLVSALLQLSCRTAPITQRPPIAVPPGLTANDVKFAILEDLANRPEAPTLTPGEHIADDAMKVMLWPFYKGTPPAEQQWFPESVEPGVIYAGYQKQDYYLRVAIDYDDTSVRLRIVGSKNLNESDGQIHKSAFKWISTLENEIARALGRFVARRHLSTDESKPIQ